MKIKNIFGGIFEIFANKFTSELIYLFILIIVWIKLVLPNSSQQTFLSIVLVAFTISRVGKLVLETIGKEKEGNKE